MKIRRTIIFILSIFLILTLLCIIFPQPNILIFGCTLRFPSIKQMMMVDADTVVTADSIVEKVEKSLQIEDKIEMARQDSMRFYRDFFNNNSARLYYPENDSTYLFSFFSLLDSLENNILHIIHYGDSQIEGDRISGYLRSRFQEKFGGSGPGLLPLQQPVGAYSVGQSLSDTVTMNYAGGMMGKKASHKRYGAMAQVGQLEDTVEIIMTINARKSRDFKQIKLFVGMVNNHFEAQISNSKKEIEKKKNISSLCWELKKPTNSIKISLRGKSEIYGINIDGGKGVSLSNIPMRGSEGTFFTQIEKKEMLTMLEELNTQLVILEYGGNALPALRDSDAVEKYCENFARQIDLFHNILPNVKVIVIGPTDMSTKINGKLQTYTLLPYLVESMREITLMHDAAYWDIYGVMGGFNSMQSWVTHSPAWAAPDYVHFTRKGAERIAEILWKTLMVYYDYRHFLKNN